MRLPSYTIFLPPDSVCCMPVVPDMAVLPRKSAIKCGTLKRPRRCAGIFFFGLQAS